MDLAKEMEALMKDSERFTLENFGLQMGSDYPEIARELLKSEELCMKLFAGFTTDVMLGGTVLKSMMEGKNLDDLPERIKREPRLWGRSMEFLFWGIQLGRQMEREQAQVLDKVAAAGSE